jgi:serine/threonine protein phosphatase PrpC
MSSDVKIICPQCQHRNLATEKRCVKCGHIFKSSTPVRPRSTAVQPPQALPPPPNPPGILGRIGDFPEIIANFAKGLFAGTPSPGTNIPNEETIARKKQSAQPQTSPTSHSVNAPTTKLNENSIPDVPSRLPPIPIGQKILGKYRNLKSIQLETCNYYEAVPLSGLSTGILQQPTPTHLIRETTPRQLHLASQDYTNLTARLTPFMLSLQQVIQTNERVYTLMNYPGGWGALAKIKMPQSSEKALAWTTQVAQALMALNQNGFGGFLPGKEGRETILNIGGEARLADITFAQRIEGTNYSGDVYALASLLHYLLTGKEFTPEASQAPPQFRAVLRRAAGGGIPTIEAFLQELETSRHMPVYERALRQSPGYLTHVGRVREHNEDYVGVFQLGLDQTGAAPPVGLYVVADGMGGQAAGEFASRGSVQQAFVQFINRQVLPELQRSTRRLDEAGAVTPPKQLENLVHVANKIVYEANRKTNTDRGTTVTAALIIGDQVHIANVGDSRTYLLRNGQLKQITQDHSLVYSLYLAGQIQEDEIYTHPRKNEIHRSIGEKAEVKVDIFNETLQAGDKLLLCSDGLWEMVRNPYIQQALASITTPQAICDHLIRMANENGGEDNITAIVVAME